MALAEGRQPAPAQEDWKVGQQQRLDDAGRRLHALAAELQADRLHRDLPVLADRVAVDLDVRFDRVLRLRIRNEHDRARRMPLGQSREDVLRGLDPLLRHPGDVRHHARALHRLARAGVHPLRAELALDLGDRG